MDRLHEFSYYINDETLVLWLKRTMTDATDDRIE